MNPTTTTFLARIQTDPQGNNPTATAFFGKTVTVDGVSFEAPWSPVSWQIKDSTKSVTVDGTTLTYEEVSKFITAIAYKEKADAEAAAAAAAASQTETPTV